MNTPTLLEKPETITKMTTVEAFTTAPGLNPFFFLTRQTYRTFKDLNIDINESLDTRKVSDRLKAEIRLLNNNVLSSLLFDKILYDEFANLTKEELSGIRLEVNDYLLAECSGEIHNNCSHDFNPESRSNCPLEKYYEITPLNTNSGTILLVVVDEGFLRKVTGSKESFSEFLSDILDYMYSIKSLPTNIQQIVQSYLRINNNEDLLTRIKVSLRSTK
ncbi:putative major capsid protein [Bacillus phage vB_BspM_AgentSmith]|nr:putative major capsid protein [Bacillus phage vB_BspM_AgentSmith]